jgi:hypothetical protein
MHAPVMRPVLTKCTPTEWASRTTRPLPFGYFVVLVPVLWFLLQVPDLAPLAACWLPVVLFMPLAPVLFAAEDPLLLMPVVALPFMVFVPFFMPDMSVECVVPGVAAAPLESVVPTAKAGALASETAHAAASHSLVDLVMTEPPDFNAALRPAPGRPLDSNADPIAGVVECQVKAA